MEPVTPALVGVAIGLEKAAGVLSMLLDADDSPEPQVLPIPVPIVDERLEFDPRLVAPAMLELPKLPLTPDDEEDESPADDVVGELALTEDTVGRNRWQLAA